MRKSFAVIAVFLLAAVVAAAQETPKIEAFVGYQFIRSFSSRAFDPQFGSNVLETPKFNTNGATAQFVYNPSKWLGVVADFGTGRKNDIGGFADFELDSRLSTFLFGPRVSFTSHRWKPYAQALFGLGRRMTEVSFLSVPIDPLVPDVLLDPDDAIVTSVRDHRNAFAMTVGGGVDLRVWKMIYVRPVGLDYLLMRTQAHNFNHLRYTAGVNFTWGAR